MADGELTSKPTSESKRSLQDVNKGNDHATNPGASGDCCASYPPAKRTKEDPESVENDGASTSYPGSSNQSGEMNGQKAELEQNGDDDNVSEISDLSDIDINDSEHRWTGQAGPMQWVHQQMMMGRDPRTVLQHIIPANAVIPDDIDDLTLWKIVVEIMSDPPKRKKLEHINTLDDVVHLLKTCKKIIVLTGAGVSVSCGIPDFRSRDGIYARLAVEYPDLPDPQAMFGIDYFRRNPRPFFKFAKEIYPGQFEPSPSHKFISLLEKSDQLLRNYTQNIDTLEQVAGISKVIQCHGSFATATCMRCKYKVDCEVIKEDIMNQVIPKCPRCPPEDPSPDPPPPTDPSDSDPDFPPPRRDQPIMKPDIVFFGESLPEEFHRQMEEDKEECDLLIVIGSSLKVRPVALIPHSLQASVPQILINREPLRNLNFDVELLGDCDGIISELCHRLQGQFSPLALPGGPASQVLRDEMETPPLMSPASAREELRAMARRPDPQESEDRGEKDGPREQGQAAEPSGLEGSGVKGKEEGDSKNTDREEGAGADQGQGGEAGKEGEGKSKEEDGDGKDKQEENGLEELREMWKPKVINLGARVKEGTFVFIAPNRYVFRGAELIENLDDTDSSSSSGESSDCSELNDLDQQPGQGQVSDNTGRFEPCSLEEGNCDSSNTGDSGSVKVITSADSGDSSLPSSAPDSTSNGNAA